jgi:predicted hotdog family 3-hydroxylacyl-ACP dehydratase
MIGKAEIRRLIPHAGAMCLLDKVASWDTTSIACIATTHRASAHPLRRYGRLAGLHAFEYGAQAAAVHGALVSRTEGKQGQPGYLAALREAHVYVSRLDDIAADLAVTAQWLTGEASHCIYRIGVSANGMLLAQARMIIIARPGPALE